MNTATSPVKNIFLADDDMDDCSFFKDALKELNEKTELTIANDGQKLLSILDETVPPPPHVIFLDLNMPGKNGFECLEEIRKTPKLSSIPVVIFSTSSNINAIDATYSLGANYYVCKPRSFDLLKKAIKKVLSLDFLQQNQPTPKETYFLAIS